MKQFGIILCILISISAMAAEEPTAAQQLQAKMTNLTTFSALFSQTTYDADGFLLDELEGRLFFNRPNHLRWEASAPFLQTMVADGENIFLYDPDLAQVTVRQWSNNPSENPAVIFLTGADLSEDFVISNDDESYTLVPRSENTSIFGLSVEFDGDVPSAMLIDDALGQKTQIKFQDSEVGIELDPAMFQFEIPDGVDVITDG